MAATVYQICQYGKIEFQKCFSNKIEVGQGNLPKKKKRCRYSHNEGCICFFVSDFHDENALQA